MDTLSPELKKPLVDLLLSVADDKLILGHRNADWTGLAPILEEDIAFSSLAQDDLAHAMALFELLATIDGRGADQIAYGRPAAEYRCCRLVELHDEFDWAVAIARQFLCDHFEQLRLARLSQSAYRPLRDLAARMLAEERLAIGHADQWVIRLGKAPEDARGRIQKALDKLAPLAGGLFEPTIDVAALEKADIYPTLPGDMHTLWASAVSNVIDAATLRFTPPPPAAAGTDGRTGRHLPEFATLLDEMTEVFRVEPNAAW
ncbi:MAG: phenylacetate-CoA oxygenase subunit PaaC [Phycisphaerales bacterium]|nr:phenylacetate-CoA oxygenase subunit PaaC [Phycisphaerales bacterium]